ncbi:hypothetical protein ACP4OV_008130 [Aristida adscensionis]
MSLSSRLLPEVKSLTESAGCKSKQDQVARVFSCIAYRNEYIVEPSSAKRSDNEGRLEYTFLLLFN